MAYKADDLKPDQLRSQANGYRQAANSTAYPATAATLLRLTKRFEEVAAEREAETPAVRQP